MLTKRQRDILLHLHHDEFIKIKDLVKILGHSEKTLQLEIMRIDEYLKEKQLGSIERRRGRGICLKSDKGKDLYRVIETEEDSFRSYLIQKLFMKSKKNIITEKMISEELGITRTILQKQLKRFSSFCSMYGVEIFVKKKYGIEIHGEEFQIRDCLIALFMEYSEYPFHNIPPGRILDKYQELQFKEMFPYFLREPMEFIITDMEAAAGTYLDHISRLNVFLHLCMSVIREQLGYELDQMPPVSMEKIRSKKMTELFNKIEKAYHLSLSDKEKEYMLLYLDTYGLLQNGTFLNEKLRLKESESFLSFMEQFVSIFNGILTIDITKDGAVREGLTNHIAGTILRLKKRIRIHNPLLDEVRESFSMIYQATWATSILFDQYFHVSISEDEVAYIALYLGVVKEQTEYKLNLCLVCYRLDTSIYLLAKQLQKLHTAIAACEILTTEQFKKERKKKDWDLILTVDKELTDHSCIHLNKILSDSDRVYLLSVFEHMLDKKILWKEKEKEELRYSCFDKELIFLSVSCEDKRELIEMICTKLYEKEYTCKEFLSSVLKREREISTEIGSGIAIPHGNTQFVKHSVIAYAYVKEGVVWSKDEIVYHIFLLAISDKNKTEVELSIKNFYKRLIQLTEGGEIERLTERKKPEEILSILEE